MAKKEWEILKVSEILFSQEANAYLRRDALDLGVGFLNGFEESLNNIFPSAIVVRPGPNPVTVRMIYIQLDFVGLQRYINRVV